MCQQDMAEHKNRFHLAIVGVVTANATRSDGSPGRTAKHKMSQILTFCAQRRGAHLSPASVGADGATGGVLPNAAAAPPNPPAR